MRTECVRESIEYYTFKNLLGIGPITVKVVNKSEWTAEIGSTIMSGDSTEIKWILQVIMARLKRDIEDAEVEIYKM